MIMVDGIVVGFCESQVHGNDGRFTINMVPLTRKIFQEFFKTKVFLQISDGFFLELESKGAFFRVKCPSDGPLHDISI